MNEKFAIRFRLTDGQIRYGQNRSATFDYSPFVLTLDKAKQFDSLGQARRWLQRFLPGLKSICFIKDWDVDTVERFEEQERIGTWNISGTVLSTFSIPNTPAP